MISVLLCRDYRRLFDRLAPHHYSIGHRAGKEFYFIMNPAASHCWGGGYCKAGIVRGDCRRVRIMACLGFVFRSGVSVTGKSTSKTKNSLNFNFR